MTREILFFGKAINVEKIDDDGFLTIKNRLSEKNGWRYARGSKNQNRA